MGAVIREDNIATRALHKAIVLVHAYEKWYSQETHAGILGNTLIYEDKRPVKSVFTDNQWRP